MYCKQCGTENENGVRFCKGCGTELNVSTPVAAAPEMKGSASQAWEDIRKEGGWFKKCLLLALIMLVPIFNFFAIGYFWGLAKCKIYKTESVYPQKIVTGENFKNGFFCVVIALIFGCIYYLLSLIPILGWLLSAASVIFLAAVASFMFVRLVCGSFSCAFRLGNVFKGYGKKFGTAIGTNILPGLIFAAIFIGFMLIYILILTITAVSAVNTVQQILVDAPAHSAYLLNPMFWISKLGSSLAIFVIVTLVFSYISNFVNSLLAMILARANAYHVERFIPEWITEFEEIKVAKQNIAQSN